jgi:uncharacterized protein DUF2793
MSLPLTPYERWESGTNQNSVPANNNSLRDEIFNTNGIADDVTAQPGSPSDGDWYIIPAGATGAQWSTFDEDSVAIFYGGNWYEFVPAEGNKVLVDGVLSIYDGSSGWVPITLPAAATWGGIIGTLSDQTDLQAALDAKSGTTVTIVTEASTSTMVPATHAGLNKYVRAADDVTFNVAQTYAAGMVFNIRATAALSLIGTGVTLTPEAGGTLDMDAAMSVTVVMTSSSAGDVIGHTVPV